MTAVAATPSRLLLQPLRHAIAAAQAQLNDTQVEATTGRHAHMTLALGSNFGSNLGLRLQLTGAEQEIGVARHAKEKAGFIQISLSQLTDLTAGFRSTLATARSSADSRQLSAHAAASALDSMRATLNISFDGQYLFAGLNAETPPIKDYGAGPRAVIVSAFTAEFGFPPDDPAASSLTPAQIGTFLDGSFKSLFEAALWRGNWSVAADETTTTRLAGEEIDTAANANAPFARAMAAAFSMIDVLGRSELGRMAHETVIDRSLLLVSEAEATIAEERSRIGSGESRLARASDRLEVRKANLASAIQALEGVDSYEAAARINMLMTELEASYALTARISRMSLLSYL